jgi:hypothetical protein
MGPPPTGEGWYEASCTFSLAPLLRIAANVTNGRLGQGDVSWSSLPAIHGMQCSTCSFTWLASALQDLP